MENNDKRKYGIEIKPKHAGDFFHFKKNEPRDLVEFTIKSETKSAWYAVAMRCKVVISGGGESIKDIIDKGVLDRRYVSCLNMVSEKFNIFCAEHEYEGEVKRKLEESMVELMRYIPEIYHDNTNFFIDPRSFSVGFIIQKHGTLTVSINREAELDFSYAKKAKFGGLFRVTGKAKTTKHIENSYEIRKLLSFVRYE